LAKPFQYIYNILQVLVYSWLENSKYGNLAAYHLESGKTTYLWDIVDEYALNDEEYYEDRKKREKKERRKE